MKKKEDTNLKKLKSNIKKELIKEMDKKFKEIQKGNLKKEIIKSVMVVILGGILVSTVGSFLNKKIDEITNKPKIELYCRGFLLKNGNHSSNFILLNRGKPIKNLDIVIISGTAESWCGDYRFTTNENCTIYEPEGCSSRRRIFCPYFNTYSEINVNVDFKKYTKESIVLYDITINGENLETENLKCYPS